LYTFFFWTFIRQAYVPPTINLHPVKIYSKVDRQLGSFVLKSIPTTLFLIQDDVYRGIQLHVADLDHLYYVLSVIVSIHYQVLVECRS